MRNVFIVCTALVVLSFGFSPFGVNPEDFLRAFNANKEKLSAEIQDGEVSYAWMYVPKELRLISLEKKGILTDDEYQRFLSDRKNYVEFLLQISTPKLDRNFIEFDATDEFNYNERLQYYSFDMQHDIVVVINQKDTISCSDYLFERNFGASPKGSFVVGFQDLPKFEQLEIILTNKAVGNTPITFVLSQEDITALPTLKNYKKWKK